MSDKDLLVPCPACDAANTLAGGQDAKTALCSACGEALFTGHPVHLTTARFNAHVPAGGVPLLVDFWASWCGPCQSMAPIFERLAAEFEPLVRFAKVDTDAEGPLAQHFGIQTIPTLSLVRNRQEVARCVGLMATSDLRRWIFEALSRPERG